ncbi:hypothetical protein Lalb_Chr16g0388691 [Lupinus albus]|uniref:Uncharacterized protein n=1 Tax=Lupinus albus TaxID=3870 RepID=A0A6A4PCI0_LUPAL|nr:hypothetical protein Lalb_Chr16g0388691 [Lupinus albus]
MILTPLHIGSPQQIPFVHFPFSLLLKVALSIHPRKLLFPTFVVFSFFPKVNSLIISFQIRFVVENDFHGFFVI